MLSLLKKVTLGASCLSLAVCANEFIAKRTSQKVSFNQIKKQLGDLFAQQLRLSAELIKNIGSLQCVMGTDNIVTDSNVKKIKQIGTEVHRYVISLDELLKEPEHTKSNILHDDSMDILVLLGRITMVLGTMQKKLITHLENLFHGDTTVFHKKYTKELHVSLMRIKKGTEHIQALNKLILKIKKETYSPHKKNTCQKKVQVR